MATLHIQVVLLMDDWYLQIIVPHASAVLDSAGETSCDIHADHVSICKYLSSESPQYRVAATNISRYQVVLLTRLLPCSYGWSCLEGVESLNLSADMRTFSERKSLVIFPLSHPC